MARNVTVTFDDGSTHVYQNVPDSVTPDQVHARAAQDFAGRSVTALDGGKGTAPDSTQPSTVSPPSGGFLDQVGDALSAAGHHVMKPLHGAAQLVENTIAAGAIKLPDNPISRYIVDTARQDNQAQAENERQYQASTPNSTGAYLGATVGEIAPFLVTGPASKLDQLGTYAANKLGPLVPDVLKGSAVVNKLAAKATSGAAQGAAVGAAQPVTTMAAPTLRDLVVQNPMAQPSYFDEKLHQVEAGAATGGALPVVAAGVSALARAGGKVIEPIVAPQKVVAPALADWVTAHGGTVDDAIKALHGDNQLVPGSLPTTAQVIPNPTLVAAEKTVAGSPKNQPAFNQRAVDNNAARLAAVTAARGAPEALQAAVDARTEATQPMIDKLLVDPTTSQPVRAQTILSKLDELDNSSFSTDPVIRKTIAALRQQVSYAAGKTNVDDYTFTPSQLAKLKDEPYIRADLLDGIRQNLRNTIRDNSSNGVVSSKQEAGLEPLADHIASALDAVNPGYRDYLAAYAKASEPINGMEAAGSVLDDVGGAARGANSAGDPQITLTGFSSALKRANKLSAYGTPEATSEALQAVQNDLQRASISNSVRSGSGSDTRSNLEAPGWLAQQIYGKNFGGNKLATVAGGTIGGAIGSLAGGVGATAGAGAGSLVANKLASIGSDRVNALVTDALLNPEKAANLLEELTRQVGPTKARAALLELSKASPQLNLLAANASASLPQSNRLRATTP